MAWSFRKKANGNKEEDKSAEPDKAEEKKEGEKEETSDVEEGASRLQRWASAPSRALGRAKEKLAGSYESTLAPATKLVLFFSIPISIILVLLQVTGVFVLPIWAVLIVFGLLAIVVLVLLMKAGHPVAAISLCILILTLGYGSWYLQATPFGKIISGQLGVVGVEVGQVTKGFLGPVNIMKQIFTGEYDPTNLWSSREVKSQYSEVKDVGVRILDVTAREFSADKPIFIYGHIDAVSFPSSDMVVELSAQPQGQSAWTCCVGSNCNNPVTLKVRQARNRYFTCNTTVGLPADTYSVDVTTTAKGTTVIAGKQFVFASPEALLALPLRADPLTAFGISRDSVASWKTGDDSINIGLGVEGDMGVLEAGNQEYFLGVNIENSAGQTGIAQVGSVDLFLPNKTVERTYSETSIYDSEDFYCNQTISNSSAGKGNDQDVLKLDATLMQNLEKCKATFTNPDIISGDRRVALIGIKLPKEKLQGQDFSTFFVLAKVNFNYKNTKTIPLVVKAAN